MPAARIALEIESFICLVIPLVATEVGAELYVSGKLCVMIFDRPDFRQSQNKEEQKIVTESIINHRMTAFLERILLPKFKPLHRNIGINGGRDEIDFTAPALIAWPSYVLETPATCSFLRFPNNQRSIAKR